MKKIPLANKSVFIAASFLVAAPLMAQQDQNLDLIGQVQAICDVGDPGPTDGFDFSSPGGSDSISISGISIQCNSANGVTVALTSRNGALQAGNVNSVNYQASLTGLSGSLNLFLNADNSGNALRAQADVAASQELADGSGSLSLDIEVPTTPTFSGIYTDTLTINLISGG